MLCAMSVGIALKLMRQYEKKEGEKATQFVECLSNMAVAGVESTFYEYTKEWITANKFSSFPRK